MSHVMRKSAFCICENTGADQLCSNRTAAQRLCFYYIDSTIPLLPKSVISSRKSSSVAVQHDLCQTWSEFSRNAAHIDEREEPRVKWTCILEKTDYVMLRQCQVCYSRTDN